MSKELQEFLNLVRDRNLLAIAVALYAVFLSLPKLSVWFDFLAPQARARKKLEVLKLRYEIEALKKTHQIPDFSDTEVSARAAEQGGEQNVTTAAPLMMTTKSRFLFGVLGASLTMIFIFLLQFQIYTTIHKIGWMGLLQGLLMLATVSGLLGGISCIRDSNVQTRDACLTRGAAMAVATALIFIYLRPESHQL